MSGTIGFDQLRVSCIIGATEKERRIEQEILVDIRVKTNFSECAKSDRLTHTICYAELADTCSQIAKKGRYHLLETFAHDCIQQILKKYSVEYAWIRIKKLSALPNADYAVVELEGFKS